MARSDKLVRILLVQGFALCLVVRAKRPPNSRSLIDIHAEPVQAIYKKINRSLNCAGDIGILYTQNKHAPSMASVEPAKQCSAKASNMLKPSRTGRKTQPRPTSCS